MSIRHSSSKEQPHPAGGVAVVGDTDVVLRAVVVTVFVHMVKSYASLAGWH